MLMAALAIPLPMLKGILSQTRAHMVEMHKLTDDDVDDTSDSFSEILMVMTLTGAVMQRYGQRSSHNDSGLYVSSS
jgi:hypothetical protein